MSTFLTILTLVLGVIVMIILFLQNHALKEELFVERFEKSMLIDSFDDCANSRASLQLEFAYLEADLAGAERERNQAFSVIEMLMNRDLKLFPRKKEHTAVELNGAVTHLRKTSADYTKTEGVYT